MKVINFVLVQIILFGCEKRSYDSYGRYQASLTKFSQVFLKQRLVQHLCIV